jgi:hypothetical protein
MKVSQAPLEKCEELKELGGVKQPERRMRRTFGVLHRQFERLQSRIGGNRKADAFS